MEAAAYLLFEIGTKEQGGIFAVDVRMVHQVLEPYAVSPVPLAPSVVAGIMTHHGRIITVIDPARLLEITSSSARPGHVVIVERRRNVANLGLWVTSVRGIVPADDLERADVATLPGVSWVAQRGEGERVELVHILAMNVLFERLDQRFDGAARDTRAMPTVGSQDLAREHSPRKDSPQRV